MIDPNRIYHGYYLDDYKLGISDYIGACDLCELNIQCDAVSDELNIIQYCLCIDAIQDKQFKKNHPDAYFKKMT